MSSAIGIIVGSGFGHAGVAVRWGEVRPTPFGAPSSPLGDAEIGGERVHVLARHGRELRLAPHEINYRANVWALQECGCRVVIALNTVGAIAPGFTPGQIGVPDQLIDYTWGREHTFGDRGGGIPHIDFTAPFDPELSGQLATAAVDCGFTPHGGTYAVTQGPRLETAAEIDRLERDGCAMVGMTALPEAALARELGLRYALLAVAVNYAAGRAPDGAGILAELDRFVAVGMARIVATLGHALPVIRAHCDAEH